MVVEDRVQIAIDNWAPRFIANGVDSNDLLQLTRTIQRWEDWSPAWNAMAAMHEKLATEAEAQHNFESAGEHYFQASMLYHFGKFMVVKHPDQLRVGHEHTVRTYQRGLPLYEFPGERVEIPYENGQVIPAILRKPPHRPRAPVVLMSPGLDSVKEELHFYGNDMLRRGMAVLALDGPGQGESEFALPLRPDYDVPVRYAIDYLATRDDVDVSQVGMLGVSLGGFFAARAAAKEPRLKAVVMLASGYSLADHFDRYPLLTQDAFIHRLKAGDEATAREKLKDFTLAGATANIHCHFLIIFGKKDRLFPPDDSERAAAEVANAELWMFDEGNHVLNNMPYKYRPQQADWLRKNLG